MPAPDAPAQGAAGTGAGKAEGALRTIGELARDTGLSQHVLRYWETRFTQLKPLTRAGNRRYYRPADVALVRRIDRLLNHEGYTVRGVQQLLASPAGREAPPAAAATPVEATPPAPPRTSPMSAAMAAELCVIRDHLRAALDEDE